MNTNAKSAKKKITDISEEGFSNTKWEYLHLAIKDFFL